MEKAKLQEAVDGVPVLIIFPEHSGTS